MDRTREELAPDAAVALLQLEVEAPVIRQRGEHESPPAHCRSIQGLLPASLPRSGWEIFRAIPPIEDQEILKQGNLDLAHALTTLHAAIMHPDGDQGLRSKIDFRDGCESDP